MMMKKPNLRVSFDGKYCVNALSRILRSAVRSSDLDGNDLVFATCFLLRVDEAINHFLQNEHSKKFFEECEIDAKDDMPNL